jgi:Flp pilus assembly pilin Flp
MAVLALLVAFVALALVGFLFAVVSKVIEAVKVAGEALEEIAVVLEKNIIR